MIRLEKISSKNIDAVLSLHTADKQKDYAADNNTSLIEAYIAVTNGGHAFTFAVCDDDTPVGFVMIGYDTDDCWEDPPQIAKGNYSLWRMMISEEYQHRGYGRKALALALDFILSSPCGPADYCWVSYAPENKAAAHLYNSFGFKETDETDNGEIIAVLQLKGKTDMAEKIIAACGNDCAVCPRYNKAPYEKTEEQLKHTAELWYRIGYRDRIVSSEEISCTGCMADNWCRFGIAACAAEKNVRYCSGCDQYPCDTVLACFETAGSFSENCRTACTKEEFENIRKAFFEKRKNLEELKNQ